MTRLVITGVTLRPGRMRVPAAAARHAQVARVKPGEPIELLDLEGAVASGRLVGWDGGTCEVDIAFVEYDRGEPLAPLVLALGVLHTEAFSWAVEKATELGATVIQPVLCERVQRRDHGGRSERWRRVVMAAVAQCGRSRAPAVAEPLPLADVCGHAVGVRLVADPGGAAGSLPPPQPGEGATVLVGPEGGFTPAEVEVIRSSGFARLWLGPRTLRAETAAVAALTLAQQHLGWLSGAGVQRLCPPRQD